LFSRAPKTILASLRCSRRLQGQDPEEDSLGACFICQDDIHTEELPRLRRTDCCRVFIHKLCLEEMLHRTSICGNCRTDRTAQNTRALPMDEEDMQSGSFWFGPGTIVFMLRLQRTVFDEIGRHGSALWNSLPFDISDDILFEYLTYIVDFINNEV